MVQRRSDSNADAYADADAVGGNRALQDLFKTVKAEVILEFLKAAALYRLL